MKVDHALERAGFAVEPEVVVELARDVMRDPDAAAKLRQLADIWERESFRTELPRRGRCRIV